MQRTQDLGRRTQDSGLSWQDAVCIGQVVEISDWWFVKGLVQAMSIEIRNDALLPYRALRLGKRVSSPPFARAVSGATVTLSESV